MDRDSVSASTSRGGAVTDDVVDKTVIWSAWKQCESLLKENNYMVELPCVKTSPMIAQIASEMFNRITTMFDEMEVREEEEIFVPNEMENDESMQTSDSIDEEESEWEDEATTSGRRDYISLTYKKKVVALAKAHPKWSLATLQKSGAKLLKKKSYLKIWEAEIAAGGTMIDKYKSINDMTFKKFEQARKNFEQVTTSTLQQWALIYAREVNCDRFAATASWVLKFKRKYGLRQRKITSSNNKPWKPNKNSRICSVHFGGREKSNNPRKISYNPTIFPDIYKKSNQIDSARAERLQTGIENRIVECIPAIDEIIDRAMDIDTTKTEIGTQTDADFDVNNTENMTILFCSIDGHGVSTQTTISINSHPAKSKILLSIENMEKSLNEIQKDTKSTASGPDIKMQEAFVGFDSITCDKAMKTLGGVSLLFFHVLLKFIVPSKDGQPNFFKKLSRHNRLLLLLMKLKLGLSFAALGWIFQISRQTASNTFFSVLKTLTINNKQWLFWPSRQAIKDTMPDTFKNYPNCRAIIDCTEIMCDTPPKVEQRVLMYSNYKGGFTIKFLLAISPSGLITFVSKGYGGRATDSFITNDSGFLNLLEPGDEVIADNGFPQIKTELLQRQCTLVMPPFALEPQFTREEVLEGYSIASVRIHVERAIQRVKIFQILQRVNVELFEYIDDIMHMICILANNKEPLIKNK